MSEENKPVVTWSHIPDEIRTIIFDMLPPTTLVWLNREYYHKYHYVIMGMIKPSRYQQYVTNMIMGDRVFVFQHIMRENVIRWFKMVTQNKKHHFAGKRYSSFLAFTLEYAITCGSEKCRRVIEDVCTEVIGPKWHKRNRSSTYKKRWTN